jgi:hypothetical protein
VLTQCKHHVTEAPQPSTSSIPATSNNLYQQVNSEVQATTETCHKMLEDKRKLGDHTKPAFTFRLLGAFAKFRKATISFITSVCPPVRPHGKTRRIFVEFDMCVFFGNLSKKFKFLFSSCLHRASVMIKTLYYPTDAQIYDS